MNFGAALDPPQAGELQIIHLVFYTLHKYFLNRENKK